LLTKLFHALIRFIYAFSTTLSRTVLYPLDIHHADHRASAEKPGTMKILGFSLMAIILPLVNAD